jgi:hypothetical protein
MSAEHATVVVQRLLDYVAGDSSVEPIVRALLDRAVPPIYVICTTLLHRSYPRLSPAHALGVQ